MPQRSFDDWFEEVQSLVEAGGASFHCRDSVRADYDNGRCAADVADEILEEYNT